ncbi:MAG: hypothetical protein PWQ22_917 [Archaeoglobaceae archaeon]|nr:hypothetical protein [Archaeoglobaceae archaeon]MDK2876507.1 hypothetical protein [Archaeoglobaceae archaeon]
MLKNQFDAEVQLEFSIGSNGKIYAYKKCDFPLKNRSRGLYFGKIEKDGLRLSIEGSFIVGKIAKKGVLEIDEEKAIKWLCGEDIEGNYEGYCILKWGEYFLGCGKGNGKRIRNYVPKDRRLRSGEFCDQGEMV